MKPTEDLFTGEGPPRIAVLIPLHNGGRFIEQALQSVLDQTLPAHEIVVVDDGSTDDGPERAERLSRLHPVTLLRTPNRGQSAARNLAVRASTSELIAFLDQDDIWYPHHLESLAAPFRSSGAPTGWSYSNLDEIDEKARVKTRGLLARFEASHPKTSLADCLRSDMYILPSAAMVRRSAFTAVGGFDETLCGYEDDDLFLRLFKRGFTHAYIDEPLSQWRIHTRSASYSPRMARSRMIFFDKLAQLEDARTMRAHVAPRIFRHVISDYLRGLKTADRNMARQGLADLRVVMPHLRSRHRLALRAALPIMASYTLSRVAYRLRLTKIPRRLLVGH